jgi:hypothetical protein
MVYTYDSSTDTRSGGPSDEILVFHGTDINLIGPHEYGIGDITMKKAFPSSRIRTVKVTGQFTSIGDPGYNVTPPETFEVVETWDFSEPFNIVGDLGIG